MGDECWGRVASDYQDILDQGLSQHLNWWPEVYRDACQHRPDERVAEDLNDDRSKVWRLVGRVAREHEHAQEIQQRQFKPFSNPEHLQKILQEDEEVLKKLAQ